MGEEEGKGSSKNFPDKILTFFDKISTSGPTPALVDIVEIPTTSFLPHFVNVVFG